MQIRTQSYSIEPIDNSRPHPKNAKRGDIEAIEESIATNGFYGAIYVQDSTGLILVGNHRWRSAKNRGAKEIPVIRVKCTDIEAERIAVADNRTADLGTYDLKTQVEQLERIAEAGSLAGTGFTDEDFAALEQELAELTEENENASGGADETPGDDDDEDLTKLNIASNPITQDGDLWILGEHRLLCGDAFDPYNQKLLLGKERADLVLTDPPYAVYGSSSGIGADVADDKMIRPFFTATMNLIQATTKDFAHVYVCCDWRSYSTIWTAARDATLSPKNCLVWDKGNSGLGSNYANSHEFLAFFHKLPKPTAMRSTARRGVRTVLAPNVARYNRVSGEEREHNAAKPRPLFEWLIGNSSDPGDLVVDWFAGSGTTICAAEKTKRRAFSTELDRRHCDIVVARWERISGQRAKRVPATARPKKEEIVENDAGGVDATPPVA